MPTAESTEPATGRVTRSLRKRLTSIDSDASCRPGTPNFNLPSIQETNTPTKRLTRRSSISTPSKETPAKELTSTPGRRLTRRRSVNISESEEHTVQPVVKGPAIPVVKEEPESPKDVPKRQLRSSSKSPNDTESTKKNNKTLQKETPKAKQQTQDANEEPEVIKLDDTIETQDSNQLPSAKKNNVSFKKEADEVEKSKSNIEIEPTPTKKAQDLSTTEKNSNKNINTSNLKVENESFSAKNKSILDTTPLQTSTSTQKPKTPKSSGKKSVNSNKKATPNNSKPFEKFLDKSSPKPVNNKNQSTTCNLNESGVEQLSPAKTNESNSSKVESSKAFEKFLDKSSPKPVNNKNQSTTSNLNESGVEQLSPAKTNESNPSKVQSSKSPNKKNQPEPLKTVVFNDSDDEDVEKSVYPKTPGLIKSKSYILDGTNDVDKDDTFKSKPDQSIGKNQSDSEKENSDDNSDSEREEADTAAVDKNTKTPHKLKLLSVESSTPIQQSNSPKKNKSMEKEITEQNEKSITKDAVFSDNDDEEPEEEKAISFPKTWTQSVSGTSLNTSKIDRIETEKSLQEKQLEEAANKSKNNTSQNSNKNKSRSIRRGSSDDDMLEEDDEDIDEYEEDEREQNAEKSVFIDDEAMEVEDGEESMDSEEREYLEQNEIPEYGESLGSEDSEEDGGDDEPDEDDAAFIVSDSEAIVDALSSDESLYENTKSSKKKKFKRIYQASESSDENQDGATKATEAADANKDDTDFCLMVDSSYEDVNAKESDDVKNLSNKNKIEKDNEKTNDSVKLSETLKGKEESRKSESKTDADVKDSSVNETKSGKLEILEQIIIKPEENEQVLSENKKLTKSPRKSVSSISADKCAEEENSAKSPRKSLKKSSILEEDFEPIAEKLEENLNKSGRRSKILNKTSKSNASVNENADNEEGNANETHKSFLYRTSTEEKHENEEEMCAQNMENETVQLEDCLSTSLNTSKRSRKSSGQNDTAEHSQQRKSIIEQSIAEDDSSDSEEEKQNLNKSKKSRKSSQNEKPIEAEEKTQRRKSFASQSIVENDSSDSEKEKQELNVSKKLRKLSQSESDRNNQRRKSIAQQSIVEDDSSDSEEEKQELNVSKKLRKSSQSEAQGNNQRRKSIAQQSIVENDSSDSEEENQHLNVSKKSRKSSQSEAQGNNQRRKSIAQQSIVENDSSDSEEEKQQLNVSKKSRKSSQSGAQGNNQRRKSIAVESSVKESSDESSIQSGNADKSSSEITDNEMESSINNPVEDQLSDNDNAVSDKTMSSFLGEVSSPAKANTSRRKSIIAANDSKLDETFQLDPKSCLSSSLHENLHRSLIKKSLNQCQQRRQSTKLDTNNDDENDSEFDEDEVQVQKKIVSQKNLSVSLNSIQIKKKNLKDTKAIRNSFTIGVSLRTSNSSEDETSKASKKSESAEDLNNDENSENEDPNDEDDDNDDTSEKELLNESEKEVLEKVKNVENIVPYKSRKSMSSSIFHAPSDAETKQKKATKRNSLCLKEDTASNSFIENLAEEKKKIKRDRKKSMSFCGVAEIEEENENVVQQPPEPMSEKKPKKPFKSKEEKRDSVKHVLERCDQMLAAANEAKLQAKLQFKKVKVKKTKWMYKEEEDEKPKEENEVEIPMVSKKDIKRKQKMQKELEKALKHSANFLTKTIQTNSKTKQKKVSQKPENNTNPSKRLEAEFLDSLMDLSKPKKKKTRDIEITPPSDKENSKKKSKKPNYQVEDVFEMSTVSNIETVETACGTVVVEPATPQKLRIQHGFRESPKTPVGFKIENVNSTSKKKSNRKLKISSDVKFNEKNLNNSKNKKTEKILKRKRNDEIKEPTYVLPKTQWTSSGFFVEEDLSNPRPLANSTATQFLVASVSSGKKNKSALAPISGKTLETAMSFKQQAVKPKNVSKECSRNVLYSKQRQNVNKMF